MHDHTTVRTAGLFAAVLAAGCGSALSDRHDELASELRRVAERESPESRGRAPFAGAGVLDRESLVREVLARNPTLEAARETWRAALARYRRVSAWRDPMLEYEVAPLSIPAGDEAPFGHTIRLSQMLPIPGEASAEGAMALAEAEAEAQSYDQARQRLAVMAATMFDEYFSMTRAIAINEQHRALLGDIRAAAEAQYAAGIAAQADALGAALELAMLERRTIALRSELTRVVAEINGLLHRPPAEPLPPPPPELTIADVDVANLDALRREALENRPELVRLEAENRARSAAVDMASAAYWPEVTLMGEYSSMWEMPEHQWMVGLGVQLPIFLGRRAAAVEEAEARVRALRAEALSMAEEILVEVDQAAARVREAKEIAALFEAQLLPTARAQVDAARVSYSTGRGAFQSLIDAERSLRNVELEQAEAHATLQRRIAELERAVGRTPGLRGEGGAR